MELSDGAQTVLDASIASAEELGHSYVGTEHLLLGLARSFPELFEPLPAAQLEEDLLRRIGRPGPQRGSLREGPPPFTSRARKVLEFASTEATRTHAASVAPLDLVHGLLEEGKGIGGTILKRAGFQPRAAPVVERREESWVQAADLILVEDESTAPYFEQIAHRIKELVASGQLGPGDRLPPVRRLAEKLNLAPGTVARAYVILEEQGVVETAGSKGTTVALPRAMGRSPSSSPVPEIADQMRPVVITAFHLGATREELLEALQEAMRGVFGDRRSEDAP